MPADQFDPADPPRPASPNPLTEYTRIPAGLHAVIAVECTIAVWFLFAGWTTSRDAGSAAPLVPTGGAAAVFLATALGVWRRRGWGWWMTCTLAYIQFFNLPVSLALWTMKGSPFSPPLELIIFAVAVLALAYLSRGEMIRRFHFPTPDGRPTAAMKAAPLVIGLLWAGLRLYRELSAT